MVEVVAPDEYRAALLVGFAASSFPAEIVSGPVVGVRLLPPTGSDWVLELLALIERWLESASLPFATVLYGGRSYLIHPPTVDRGLDRGTSHRPAPAA